MGTGDIRAGQMQGKPHKQVLAKYMQQSARGFSENRAVLILAVLRDHKGREEKGGGL